MTQTPVQIKRVLREGEYRLNKEPATEEGCRHEWRYYKTVKGMSFFKCKHCGELSD